MKLLLALLLGMVIGYQFVRPVCVLHCTHTCIHETVPVPPVPDKDVGLFK
jgi:hypothetical protein